MAKLIYGYHGVERFGDHWAYAPFGRFADGQPAVSFSEVTLEQGYSRTYDSNLDGYYAYDEYGALVVSPGAILGKAEIVDAAVESLNADVEANTSVDAAVVTGWQSFYGNWKAFFASLQGVSGWLSRLWGSAMDQVEQFQADTNNWQKQLSARGVQVTAPPLDDPNAGSWKPLLYGAIALAAIGLGIKVVGMFGSIGSATHAMAEYEPRTRRRRRY